MTGNIKAHPTFYKRVRFRSRLEARWAAFFDLIGWRWEYEPLDLNGWTPDFRVTFDCLRPKSCCPEHSLLVEVKPYYTIDEFDGHPCLLYNRCTNTAFFDNSGIPADASAAFGVNPNITIWSMIHGDGGGPCSVAGWLKHKFDIDDLWSQAGNIVQWNKS